jgi:hypothetical protein
VQQAEPDRLEPRLDRRRRARVVELRFESGDAGGELAEPQVGVGEVGQHRRDAGAIELRMGEQRLQRAAGLGPPMLAEQPVRLAMRPGRRIETERLRVAQVELGARPGAGMQRCREGVGEELRIGRILT